MQSSNTEDPSSQEKTQRSYKNLILATLGWTLWLFAAPSAASLPTSNAPLETQYAELTDQRALYTKALRMIDQRNWRSLRRLREELFDYPLYPYLEYADLTANMSVPRRAEISNYLERNADSVLAYRLRSKWLAYLAKRGQWTNYLTYYRDEEASTARRCQFHIAQYHRQQRAAAIAGGLELWAVENSQPRQCNALFDILIRHDEIDDPHAWQRFQLALLAHNYSLARYTQQFMTESETRHRAETFYQLDRQPASFSKGLDLVADEPRAAIIVAHSLRHTAARNPQQAIKNWQRAQQRMTFTDTDTATLISALVKGLIKVGDQQQADTYLQQHSAIINTHLEGDVIEWRIRHALKEQNWPDVLRWIDTLSAERQQRSAWRYWRIRSLENTPQSESNPRLQLTRELALERDFYGFLASEKLQKKYSFNHRPLQVDEAISARVSAMPALHRARELYFHEFIIEANREWHAATREFVQVEWEAVASLTHQWQWHSRAIMAMARAEYWDDIVIRFPLAYQNSLQRAAQSSGVASPTLFAIARQESAFERRATSSAGAIGMLQIMPATARETARKFAIPYRNKMQLRDIETNLPIGSQYYKSLLTRFNNNRILATAAYNAGPDRVAKWLARSRGELPFDIWVELIPFKETRGYVTNVLMYSAIYSHRLGIDTPMLRASERERLL